MGNWEYILCEHRHTVECAKLSTGSAHCIEKPRGSRGGTQGGLNCLTHVLPRCLPTPTEEADGGGERL